MKTRYMILDTYCCGYLTTTYTVKTKAEALKILKKTKKFNEPNAHIVIYKQTKKWYQRFWRTEIMIAEWWSE